MLARARNANPELESVLRRAQALAETGLGEARHAITALRGDSLPGPELLPALVEEHRAATAHDTRFEVTGEPVDLPPDARLAVYRVAQEALTNVRKHAPGASVDVDLAWREDAVVLVVEDLEPEARPATICRPGSEGAGYGLTGMAERAELLGGRLTAAPTRQGFRVELCVPLRRVPA